MEPKILINGSEVSGLDDLPEDLRNILEDKNNNGIPDIAENPFAIFSKLGELKNISGDLASVPQILRNLQTAKAGKFIRKIDINGQTFESWDQVPEELKQKLKQEMIIRKEKAQQISPVMSAPSTPLGSSNPVRPGHEAGRNFLLILALMGLAGWFIYQYMLTGS